MSERTVFGRRKVQFEGRQFTIEMRDDGIYVRLRHSRKEWKLPFEKLLNHAKLQPEFFYSVAAGDENQPVPDMSEGPLVPGESNGANHTLHESGEQTAEAP